jgi:hypothetical protein
MDRVANLPLAAQVVLGVGALFITYAIVQRLTTARRRQAVAREKGCLPPPAYPQWDTVLGVDIFRENIRALKAHNFLDTAYKRFHRMGVNTYQMMALGRRFINTTEPENLKTIQAINFKQWGLGGRRKVAFRPFLGDGKVPDLSHVLHHNV